MTMPPRAQFRDTVLLRSSIGALSVAGGSALVALYDVGTSSPIGEVIYAAASGAGTLNNPVVTDPDGTLNFWLAEERELDVVVSCPGFRSVRVTVTSDSAGNAIDFALRNYVGYVMGSIDPGGTPAA
jgi:hypothetical protein